MSVTIATRGYVVEIRQAVDDISPFPSAADVQSSAVAPDSQTDASLLASSDSDVTISASDDSAKVLGSDDEATIRIIPCDD